MSLIVPDRHLEVRVRPPLRARALIDDPLHHLVAHAHRAVWSRPRPGAPVLEGVLGDELPAPRAAEDALGHVDALRDRRRGKGLAPVALPG